MDKPALTSTLVDGGLDSEAARRFVDLIERQQAELAAQAGVDRRADVPEGRIADRAAALEQRLADLNSSPQRHGGAAATARSGDSLQRQLDEAEAETSRRIDAFRGALNQRFKLVFWMIGAGVAINLALFGAILFKLF